MRTVRLVLHQLRYDRKRLQRDPAGLFYAVGMPLIFLFVFVAILGSSTEVGTIGARTLVGAGYYLPAIITLSAVSATFVQLSVSITAARERGTLKRVRGTPVPTWVFIAGRIGMSVLVTLLLVVLVIAVGWAIADVSISRAAIPGAILALVVAAASLSCAAFAFSAAVPSPGLAAAAGFGGTLVLYFLSGMFVHTANIPGWAQGIADAFPIKHLFEALAPLFDPTTTGTPVLWRDLAVIGGWGLGCLVLGLRCFRWTPSRS